MEDMFSTRQAETAQVAGKRAWEEPAIVLERSLLAAAQDPAPTRRAGRARSGLLGPLNTSGGMGTCD